MAGVGVRQQWELSKFFARQDSELQRPICMQQLSLNGSLLLAKNHDPTWLYHLSVILDQPLSSWRHYSQILLSFPGPIARRALWRASRDWLESSYQSLPQLAEMQLQYGGNLDQEMTRCLSLLELTALQLEALRWCEQGKRPGPLQIMDLAEQRQISARTDFEAGD
jgi:hypothetical protein